MKKAVPEVWKKVRLDSVLSTIESGRRPKGGSLNIDDGIPSVGGEHITSSGEFNFKNTRYVPEKFYEELTTGKIKTGDVLIVKDGATTGKVAIVQESFPFKEACINEHIFILRGNQSLINPFLFYHLYSKNGQQQIANTFQGSAQGGINYSFIKNCDILLPPLPDQQKIATILSSVDTAIEKTKAVIEQTKVVKKGLMQELLTRGIPGRHKRFKKTPIGEIPEEWEVVKLKDISKIGNGSTPSKKETTYWKNGTIPWLATGKVNERIIRDANSFITEKALNECSVSILPKGTILVAMIGQGKTRGMVAYLDIGACINQNFAYIKPSENLNSWFLFYLLEFQYEILRNSGRGSNQDALNCAILKAYKIPVPSIIEQRQITKVFQEIGERLLAEEKVMKLLEFTKYALMQVLLTGKVKVKI